MLGPDYFKKQAALLTSACHELRCHLHRHPELSFKEYETSRYLKNFLAKQNISVHREWIQTGFTTLREFASTGKTVGIRCELDALPIQEENQTAYASENPGVMHACGHDFHTAAVVGVLMLLQNMPGLKGRLVGIFQPGEEKLPGGANLMLQQGLFDVYAFDALLAQHVTPEIPEGKIGLKPGEFMASTDEIYIAVKGKGGHAAMPHKYQNPIPVLSEIILRLYKTFASEMSNNEMVFAIGQVMAEGATNVIPEYARAAGTLRTFDEKLRSEVHQKIKQVCEEIASSFNIPVETDIRVGYPSLLNDEKLTETTRLLGEKYFGSTQVMALEKRMTAEDFAFFSRKVPVCFYRLGTGNAKRNMIHGVHTSQFDASEEALTNAIGFMAYAVYHLLCNE
jgi:amidohydrolase